MEDSRARGEVKQNGQHQEAPRPSRKRAKTVQATMKRFLPGGGGSESDDLARVMLEKTDKTIGRNRVKKTKYYHHRLNHRLRQPYPPLPPLTPSATTC